MCYINIVDYILIDYRGVAQLVARVVWDHEVAGSIPVASTTVLRTNILEYQSF